jgi:hypothetical protein
MSGSRNIRPVAFTSSATSAEVDIGAETLLGIKTPDGFGETTITFQELNADGDYENIQYYPDSLDTPAAYTITVDDTTGYNYDLTDSFPASARKLRLVASGSITETVQLVTKGV